MLIGAGGVSFRMRGMSNIVYMTTDKKQYDTCIPCNANLNFINFDNTSFGSKPYINNIKTRTKNEVVNELKEITKFNEIFKEELSTNNINNNSMCNEDGETLLTENKFLNYIYNIVTNEKNKNTRSFCVKYCKKCQTIYHESSIVYHKFLGIPYYYHTVIEKEKL